MDQKGGVLIGIIIVSLLIIPLLVVLNFGYLGSLTNRFTPAGEQEDNTSVGPAGLLNQAEQTKIQANLKAISTGLEAYMAETGAYPNSLTQVSGYFEGIDTTNIVYTKCSSSSAIIYHNSENYTGYILGGAGLKQTSGEVPNC
jgi:hypothetical protein